MKDQATAFSLFPYTNAPFQANTPNCCCHALPGDGRSFHTVRPLAPSVNTLYKSCSDNWWMDVLYVNNFLAFNATTNTLTDCLGQCWYTAVDTQLYLVAPFVLLPLAFYPSKGKILLFLVTLVSFIIPAAVTYAYDLPPGRSGAVMSNNVDNTGYERKVYYTPWCRMSAYIVGIWTGYIIFNQGSKKLVLSPVQVLTGWTVAVFSALAVLLGAWSYNHIGTTYYYDPITQVLYGGLHRGVCVSLWLGWCGLSLRLRRCSEYFPLSSFVAASLSPHILHVPRRASHSDHSDFQHQGPSLFHPCEKIIQTCGTVFLSLIRPVALAHGSSSRENYIQATQESTFSLASVFCQRSPPSYNSPRFLRHRSRMTTQELQLPHEKQGQDNLASPEKWTRKADLAKKEEAAETVTSRSSQTPYSEKEQTH
ncbi:putative nose resistant to fluoxetine protein 6 [Penaeus vannamei]|uniref:Putative nose resistant to fluoxetine protein 6 n=1 Tax=Penaeus vannamei TaxID=6689 RepID=A0A3R7T183_PENVA|nr:putative nose resistant to fluoxetine protein 6 [Penaeus vannamei]